MQQMRSTCSHVGQWQYVRAHLDQQSSNFSPHILVACIILPILPCMGRCEGIQPSYTACRLWKACTCGVCVQVLESLQEKKVLGLVLDVFNRI